MQVPKQCTLNLNLAVFHEEPLIQPEGTWPLPAVYHSEFRFHVKCFFKKWYLQFMCVSAFTLKTDFSQPCEIYRFIARFCNNFETLQPLKMPNMFASTKKTLPDIYIQAEHMQKECKGRSVPFHDWLVWEQEILPSWSPMKFHSSWASFFRITCLYAAVFSLRLESSWTHLLAPCFSSFQHFCCYY